jgi:hypothetical protein
MKIQYTHLKAVGVGRGADMSLTGVHPLWDKILLHNLQAVADKDVTSKDLPPLQGGRL